MWWLFWLNNPIWHRYTTFETMAAVLPEDKIIEFEEFEDDLSDYLHYYWHLPDKNEDINI